MPLGAWVTLLSSLFAVAAATFIGLRQVAISQRQAEISERQLNIAESSIREKIFDRRMLIYEALEAYFTEAITTGGPPKETFSVFHAAILKSKFLLSQDLNQRLEALLEDDKRWRLNRARIKRHALSDDDRRIRENASDDAEDAIFNFANQMRDLFVRDLDLSKI